MNGIIPRTDVPAVSFPAGDLNLDLTLDCGQCFRWERRPDGSWDGVIGPYPVNARVRDGRLIVTGGGGPDFEATVRRYFDLDRDYASIRLRLSADPVLKRAIAFAPGIRILRQEPWEALCSFIISQNNNIPRIKGIIARLCEHFGRKLERGGPQSCGEYAFPTPQALRGLSAEDLKPLRCGFRAGYILDAAAKVSSGLIDLDSLPSLPLDKARAELMKIRGVGPKVADCTLLFGCGRLDCFPADVWIKRALASFYPGGFPAGLAPYGGVAQQYLYHYARCCRLGLSDKAPRQSPMPRGA